MAEPYDVPHFVHSFPRFTPFDLDDAGVTATYPTAELRFPAGSHALLTDGRVLHCANIATDTGYKFADAVVLAEAADLATYYADGATDAVRVIALHPGSHASSGTPGVDYGPSVVGNLGEGPDGNLWLGIAATAGGAPTFDGSVTGGLDSSVRSSCAYLVSSDDGATWTAGAAFAAFETRTYSAPTYTPHIEYSNSEVYTEGGSSGPLMPLGRPIAGAGGTWWAPGPYFSDGGLYASRSAAVAAFRSSDAGATWTAATETTTTLTDLVKVSPFHEGHYRAPDAFVLFDGVAYWHNGTGSAAGHKTHLFAVTGADIAEVDEASVGTAGDSDASKLLGNFLDGALFAISGDSAYRVEAGVTPTLVGMTTTEVLALQTDIPNGSYLVNNYGPAGPRIILHGSPYAWSIAVRGGWTVGAVRIA